jgi:hypothetical protein
MDTDDIEADSINVLAAGEHHFLQFWGLGSNGMQEVKLILPAAAISRVEAVARS